MTAAEASAMYASLKDQYREAVRHDQEVHAHTQRVRLQMYALRLAQDPVFIRTVESEAGVSGAGVPSEVLAPFRR